MTVSAVTFGAELVLSARFSRTTLPLSTAVASLLLAVMPISVLVTNSVAVEPLSLTVSSHGPSR